MHTMSNLDINSILGPYFASVMVISIMWRLVDELGFYGNTQYASVLLSLASMLVEE